MAENNSQSEKKVTCPKCSKLRPLDKHLYELAEYCMYLGNVVEYKKDEIAYEVNTETIANWLRLASELEKVEINMFKFSAGDTSYCGTAADYYDRHSEHLTKYSTDLTRFIFVSFALEETYRFVAHNYDEEIRAGNFSPGKKIKEPSMKAAFLLDQCSMKELAKNQQHTVSNLSKVFDIYINRLKPRMSGMDGITNKDKSYGLHLVRNLRNHIAHGAFPLNKHPDDYGGDKGMQQMLALLVNRSSRVSALCIQTLVAKYGREFNSWEYNNIDGEAGREEKRFLRNCTPIYARKLHLQGSFQLENWLGN